MPSSPSPFTLSPNATHLVWSYNGSSAPHVWPPMSSMQVWVSEAGRACTETCQEHGLVCEPTFFEFLNKKDVFLQ